MNESSEELVRQAKEYALGSKRFKRSKKESVECFKKAHDMGNARGTFGLALAYFEGNHVPLDRKRAIALVTGIIDEVEDRAGNGEIDYLVVLADMFSFGLGKPVDYHRAFELYLRAAENGNLEAQCDIGYMCQVGQGTEVDISKTIYWWERSAKAGYAHSCYDIAKCYFEGEGVQIDYQKAIYWFEKAAECNYAYGLCGLAHCFLLGLGVEKDEKRAVELFQIGLEQDIDRGRRYLMNLNIDTQRFIEEGKIVYNEIEPLVSVSDSDINNGKMFINAFILEIDPRGFYDCATLEKINVDVKNPSFCSIDGVLYSKDKQTLIRYPTGRSSVEFILPGHVRVVGPNAFQNSKMVKRIILNDGLEEIRKSAFDDCKSLLSINIPDSVKSIGEWAFHGNDALTRIELAANISTIGKYAFGSCEKLTEILVDDKNKAYRSVDNCLYDHDMTILIQYPIGRRERNFVVPDSVRVLDFRAFSDAFHLEEVTLGANVEVISDKVFYYATRLRRVIIEGKIIHHMGKNVFDQTSAELQILVPSEYMDEFRSDEYWGRFRISSRD